MRLFILGAGFSKPAGMPLATELTESLISRVNPDGWIEDFGRWLDYVRRRLGAGVGESSINVEQLFHIARFDIELLRLQQQMSTVGRDAGDTVWQAAEDIQRWLEYLEQELVEEIIDCQIKCNRDSIVRWANHLRTDDRIASFNYDTLVEQALDEREMDWHHGMPIEAEHGPVVCKLHGSVDWFVTERGESLGDQFAKLFEKTDVNAERQSRERTGESEYDKVLLRASDLATALEAVHHRDLHQGTRYASGLAGLGMYKQLHSIPGLGHAWQHAIDGLLSADEIYVIGFSFSDFDGMARWHFGSAFHQRAARPSRVVVIDPALDSNGCGDLHARIQRVFGDPIVWIPRSHEDVDWLEVLATS